MATFKEKMKYFGAQVWALFKGSLLSTFMYCCAGSVLMMLVLKGKTVDWTSSDITWTVVCILGGVAYNVLAAWANGGSHYEMLVSGNIKRSTYDAYGNQYKMSNHKIAKEYRPWKGFVMGAFTAILPIVFGILAGLNQEALNSQTASKGVAVLLLLSCLLSGWSILPFYCMGQAGIAANYFLSLLFAIIPIVVTGGAYIAGAYARRNKAIRQQQLAEAAARAEEERQKNKKINYGGLPGTKPRKRK